MPCGLIGMYWVKCKQSTSHTSLTTLCSHFLLSYGNQSMTKSAHWWSWSYDLHGYSGWGEFFSWKYSRRPHRHQQRFIFFTYKQVSGRSSNHEWLRMTNPFILCDLLWKVQKCHAANRKGSFKVEMLEHVIIMMGLTSEDHSSCDYNVVLWRTGWWLPYRASWVELVRSGKMQND